MDELISIIIPVFNRFEYADRAILSVLNQSYNKWELFIVDDCSNKAYQLPAECNNIHQQVILLRNQNNAGPGVSRQRGLDLANGRFVCFLDSDDYWLPGFLEKSINEHVKNKFNIGATYCQSKMSDGTLRRRNELNEAVDDIFFGVVSGARPWATCALMWNRSFITTWTNQRTNQDAYFEIGSSILNPHIKFISEILCVIDKETNFNTQDLVKKSNTNKDRLSTLLFAQSVFNKYQGPRKMESYQFLIDRSLSRAKRTIFSSYFFLGLVAVIKTLIFKFKHLIK